jgi:hypothetical protein
MIIEPSFTLVNIMPRIIFPTSTRTKFAEDNHISPPNLDQESSLLQDLDQAQALDLDHDHDHDICFGSIANQESSFQHRQELNLLKIIIFRHQI